MSQKTNPLSLRLQKTSRNFAFPWFADFFWTEIYLKNLEIENYITPFLKQTQYSKAFFSAKNFYRKYSIFVFLYDTRLGKKKNQLTLKKKALISNLEKRSPNMIALLSQKMISNRFSIDSSIYPLSNNIQERSKKLLFENGFSFCERNVKRETQRFSFLRTPRLHPTLQLENSQSKIRSLFELKRSPKVVGTLAPNVSKEQKHLENKAAAVSISFSDLKALQTLKLQAKSLCKDSILDRLNFDQKTKNKVFHSLVYEKDTFSRFFPVNIHFQPIRFLNYHQNVIALTDQVVHLLEKRISFRQIKYLLINNALRNQFIKGIRISCSGRLGGRSKKAQKAKLQSDSIGRTPLASFSSKISFCSKSAYTPYGKVGVKIWLCFKDHKN